MYDIPYKYHFALSPLLFPSPAQRFWEPNLKYEAFNGQEHATLPVLESLLGMWVAGFAVPRLCPHLCVLATLCLDPEIRQMLSTCTLT